MEQRCSQVKPITFDSLCYRIDGRPVYLNSGEFHYFRVPKADWLRRMRLFKEVGGNCIATYCPWLLHEPDEGRFAFGGDDGMLDLEGFLRTAQEAGLYVIARPGPYQYSELLNAGLPDVALRELSAAHGQADWRRGHRTVLDLLHPSASA